MHGRHGRQGSLAAAAWGGIGDLVYPDLHVSKRGSLFVVQSMHVAAGRWGCSAHAAGAVDATYVRGARDVHRTTGVMYALQGHTRGLHPPRVADTASCPCGLPHAPCTQAKPQMQLRVCVREWRTDRMRFPGRIRARLGARWWCCAAQHLTCRMELLPCPGQMCTTWPPPQSWRGPNTWTPLHCCVHLPPWRAHPRRVEIPRPCSWLSCAVW